MGLQREEVDVFRKGKCELLALLAFNETFERD